jgi:stringent starvation protein B
MSSEDKFSTLELFLEKEFVLVHLNSGAQGVVVPEHLKNNPSLILKLSRLFAGVMSVDPQTGITAELLFSGSYFTCMLPLEAIWGIVSSDEGEGKVWEESAPSPLLAAFLSSSLKKAQAAKEKKRSEKPKPNQSPQKPRPSYLKRVK